MSDPNNITGNREVSLAPPPPTGTTPTGTTPTESKPYRAPRPKRTRPVGPRARLPITVGGVEVSYEDAVAALEILTAAPGVMVKQPLARASNPLAEADYHGFANEVRASDPKLANLNTKPAFLAGLARLTGR